MAQLGINHKIMNKTIGQCPWMIKKWVSDENDGSNPYDILVSSD